MNTVTLDGILFSVESCSFDASYSEFDDSLIWSLEVACSQGANRWTPNLTVDLVVETGPGEIARWQDIAGRRLEWNTRLTGEEAPAVLYQFEHLSLDVGEINVLRADSRLRIRGTCRTDLSMLELSADALVVFDVEPADWGVEVASTDEVWARRVLSPLISLDDLEAEVARDGLRFRSRTYGRTGQDSG